MLRSADDTATLIALMYKRSELSRVRISQTTLKFLSVRKRLRASFVATVTEILRDYYDLTMIELDNGAFGILRTSSLEGAKAITAKLTLEDLLPALRKGRSLDFEKLEDEIVGPSEDYDE